MICHHQGFLGDQARGNIHLEHSLRYNMYTDTIIVIIRIYYYILSLYYCGHDLIDIIKKRLDHKRPKQKDKIKHKTHEHVLLSCIFV